MKLKIVKPYQNNTTSCQTIGNSLFAILALGGYSFKTSEGNQSKTGEWADNPFFFHDTGKYSYLTVRVDDSWYTSSDQFMEELHQRWQLVM